MNAFRRGRILLFVAVLVGVFGVLLGASSANGLVPAHDQVIRAAEAEDFDKALRLIRALRDNEPNDYRHIRLEALVYRNIWNSTPEGYDESKRDSIHATSLRLLREAIEMAERWGADDKVVAEMHERIARAHLARRDHELAIRELTESLRRWPDHVLMWALLGDVYWDMYSVSTLPQEERVLIALKSAEYHEKAVQLNGGTDRPRWLIPEAYINAGNKRLSDGDLLTAERYLIVGIGQLGQAGMDPDRAKRWREGAFGLLAKIAEWKKQ